VTDDVAGAGEGTRAPAERFAGDDPIDERRATASDTWIAAGMFIAFAAVAWIVAAFAVDTWWNNPANRLAPAITFPHEPWFEAWVRADAGWYLEILTHGYSYHGARVQSPVAFFPAYPVVVSGVERLIQPVALAAIYTTVVCGLLVAVLFFRWCATRIRRREAFCALLVLLAYPFAFYLFGAVYADALFLAAILAAFLLLEADHVFLAGLAGALATATRPVGIAVVIGLVVRLLERRGALVGSRFSGDVQAREGSGWAGLVPRGLAINRLRPSDSGILLSAAGLVAYMGYLAHRFGEPLAFITVQGSPGWDQGQGLSTWLKFSVASRLVHPPYDRIDVAVFSHAFVTIAFLAIIPFVVRRFGWGYGVYACVIVLFPAVSTRTFSGMGRYCLAAFPCFVVVGSWLASRRVLASAYVVVSASLMAVCLVLYTHGLEV
jgi:hypothetical protein